MREPDRLLVKAVAVVRGLAPHARQHRTLLAQGAVAASFVVAARLALPWPLRVVAERWVGDGARSPGGLEQLVPAGIDPVIAMGGVFMGLLLLLGFSDYSARQSFARFAIGTVRDLRASVLRSVVRLHQERRAKRPGDLISRLVGDTARIKSALQGFLVHVATNGLVLVGVSAIVFSMSAILGIVFATASAGAAVLAVVFAKRVFRKSLKFRKREGEIADQIQEVVVSDAPLGSAKQLNRSSARHEATLTHLQGIATGVTHGIFGLAMLIALVLGSRAVESGEVSAADMVVLMMYALTMRGPIVRLVRQGSRSGKVLGPAYRLVRLQTKADAKVKARERASAFASAAQKAVQPPSEPVAVRVLFSGYAPVHFLCFRPLYERLRALPGVEVFVSGGLRTKRKNGWKYDAQALYAPLGVPADRILSVNEVRKRDFDVAVGANTKLILPRSASKTIQIFHGISFRNKAVRSANMSCDHYFLIGPYMHRRFVDAGLLRDGDERAVSAGFMKTDRLLNGELDRAQLLQRFGFSGKRPILLYAPTGARYNSMETMGEQVISNLASGGRFDLLVKPHDHPKNCDIDWGERLDRYEDDHCRVVHGGDVTPLLYLADLLLTDASSVANEYSLLDRPIVFLDTPMLLAHAQAAAESAVDLDTWGRKSGALVSAPGDVGRVVEASLRDPHQYSEIRRAMAKDFFYNPGKATDVADSWFREQVLRA